MMASMTDFAKKISNFDAMRSQLNDDGRLSPFIRKHGEFSLYGRCYKYSTTEIAPRCKQFDYTIDNDNDSDWENTDLDISDVPNEVLIGIYHDAIEESKRYKREDVEKERLDDINEAFEQNKYKVDNGCTWWIKVTRPIDKAGRPLEIDKVLVEPYETPYKLSNFSAQIIKEITKDDGAEQLNYFVITGKCGDRDLPPIEVPADKFADMGWITQGWGADPVINAGHQYKDHLRAAIQYLSPKKERYTIYSHIGWRKIGDRWHYLHAGGAINGLGNTTSIEVEPGDSRLRFYELPEPPYGEALINKIHAVLTLLDGKMAPEHVIYPFIGGVFRAPLCEAHVADFTTFNTGRTGTRKTALQALVQAFYGAGFDEINLPGNWTSTANALERLAFLVKDALFTVDDFAPRDTGYETQRQHEKADRLLRNQANKAGRQRMRQDGTLAPENWPRGIIQSSGEDVPTGHSLRGRMLITDLHDGDVDLNRLSLAQEHAKKGVYAEVMAAYLKYLTLKMNGLKRTLKDEQNTIRDRIRHELYEAGAVDVHPKTPTTLASLYIGFSTFLDFIKEESLGTFTVDYCNKLREDYMSVLIDLAFKQIDYTGTEDPVNRFIRLVQTALTAGYAYVADADDNQVPSFMDDIAMWGWRRHKETRTIKKEDGSYDDVTTERLQPMGRCIGWLAINKGEFELYLQPDATYAVIQTIVREQGREPLLTASTLWKRLKERGVLRRSDVSRATIRAVISGHQKRALCLSSDTIHKVDSGEQ